MSRYRSLSRNDLERMLAETETLLRGEERVKGSDHSVYDLQLHKIELEIQNRELLESQRELEVVRDQYAELYDFAPVGYLSLDKKGNIINLNLSAAAMFGEERARLIGMPFVMLLEAGMSHVFFNHLRQAFSIDQNISGDFTLKATKGDGVRYVRADTIAQMRGEDGEYCLMNLLDITEQRRAQLEIVNERTFLQNVIDALDHPIMVIGLDYRVLRLNRAAERVARLLKLDPDTIYCYQLSHHSKKPCSGEDYPCPLKEVLQTGLTSRVVHRHLSDTGIKTEYEISVSPLFSDAGDIVGVIESSHDITEHIELLDELKARELSYAHLAQHDPLTGLPNRLLFADRLSQAIHVSHRSQSKLAILFIDLDRFKEVNDSFDHSCGDDVLKEVSTRLQKLFREDDTIARMGGDEFTVILSHLKHATNAALIAKKILDTFKVPFTVYEHQIFLGASIGISIYPEHGDTVDELVRNADTAMYRAKEAGRNTFQFYLEELTAKAFERVFLASGLHHALKRNELRLYYQPQIDLISNKVCGIEALVRWQNAELGLVAPSKFIQLAEEFGIIDAMGKWILKEACQQMKSWQDSGIIENGMSISVNLSGKQFDQSHFVEEIKQILDETGLQPACLELEITETIMMKSIDITRHTLARLRMLGVKVAIDDFGTGYSSLNYLKRLPITRLKIDKSFVSDIPDDLNDIAIAKAIIALGVNLSLDVLAEGVETEEQQKFLIQQGCHLGQGYLLARSMTAAGFESFMHRRLDQKPVQTGAK